MTAKSLVSKQTHHHYDKHQNLSASIVHTPPSMYVYHTTTRVYKVVVAIVLMSGDMCHVHYQVNQHSSWRMAVERGSHYGMW